MVFFPSGCIGTTEGGVKLSSCDGVTPIYKIFHEKVKKWCNGVTCIYTDVVLGVTRCYTAVADRVYRCLLGGVTRD